MKTSTLFNCLVVLVLGALVLGTGLPAYAGETVTPIPWEGQTSLPDYSGAPAKAHPMANTGVPQNPLLAPNGFNSAHLDPWMSDAADVAGPLGLNPAVISTNFAEVRNPDPNDPQKWIFSCTTQMFD